MNISNKYNRNFLMLFVVVTICILICISKWKEALLDSIPVEYIRTLKISYNLPFASHKYIIYPDYTWFIVSQENQYRYWITDGLPLPTCDFSKNYLIVSKYKLKKLFFNPKWIDPCCGVPSGYADIDRMGSETHRVYIYRMPRILLAQALG
jgi:hypothetical protein